MHDEKVQKVLRANLSPRYCELERLEAYAKGTQYEGRASFFDAETPLFDRAPCIVVPIVPSAARSFCDMLLGEGRAPDITSRPDEDDEVFDPRLGLNEEDSADLDRGIDRICTQAGLVGVWQRMLKAAQVCKTAVGIAGIRYGKLFVDTTKAKWSTPTFDPERPDVVVSLEIKYPYIDTYRNARGELEERVLIYRRVIDAQSDITFLPAQASDNGADPDAWKPDPKKTFQHGFGFCPVVWYPFLRETESANHIDGHAIHEELFDELDALNFARSMQHRAALYSGDPLTYETGVEDDENPAPLGDQARSIYLPGQNDHPGNLSWRMAPTGGGGGKARRRGAGTVWRYRNPAAKVGLLALEAGALKPLSEDGDKIEAMLAEAMSYVPIDVKELTIHSNLSGKALEWIFRRQTDKALTIRPDLGKHCILRSIDLLLRIVYATPPGRLRLAGADRLRAILQRFYVPVEVAEGEAPRAEWVCPELTLKWPPFFPSTEVDAAATGNNVRADHGAGLITKRTAVEKMAPYYGITDVDAYLDALEDEGEPGILQAAKMLGPEQHEGEGQPGVEGAASAGGPPNAAGGGQNGAPPQGRGPSNGFGRPATA